MADQLKLQVLFAAMDKLTGPLKAMRGGSRGLAADLANTRKELRALGQAQNLVKNFKLKDAALTKRTAELEAARAATAKFRSELAATDAPTIKMAKNLERAEKREAALTKQHSEQAAALADLRTKLDGAGVEVTQLAKAEETLASKTAAATAKLEAQQARAAKLGAARRRGEALQATGGKMAATGGAMTVGVTTPIIIGLKAARAEAIASRDALNQTAASIAGMGNASQRTIPQLVGQAKALQKISLFDDDDILRKVTTSMLTFDKVSGPIFDRAQAAAVNLSAKFGKDLQSSSMMVGKALNNPLKGLTALTKIGVSFTDAQKEQVAAMMAAGNTAGAQAIIMAELERQTNGAAKAARDANPDAASLQAWGEMKETIGEIVIKILPPFTEALLGALNAFNSLSPGTQKFLVIAAIILAVLGPVITLFAGIVSIVGAVAAAFSIAFAPALGIVALVVAGVALLAYGAYQLYQSWSGITGFFSSIWEGIKGFFVRNWTDIRNVLLGALVIFFPLVAAVIWVARQIYLNWDKIKAATMALVNKVAGIVGPFIAPFLQILGFLGGLVARFFNFGVDLVKGLINGIVSMVGSVVTAVWDMAKKVGAAFASALGIKSPSRVFMAFGGHIASGLALGLDRGSGRAMKSMQRMIGGIGTAAAIGISAPAMGQGAGGGGNVYNTITIHLTGSGNTVQDAQAIKRELDRLLAIDARGNYADE